VRFLGLKIIPNTHTHPSVACP